MVSREWFRFQPTDEQLISFLEMKRLHPTFTYSMIKECNIYRCHPRELLGLPSMSDEQVCYIFCTLDPKNDKDKLHNRKAKGGSWKITCKDRDIMAKDSNKKIGVRRTLSFYEGSATKTENWTDYKMYEYHEYLRKDYSSCQGEAVVCRIEKKPNKKRKSYSALDEGQTSDSFAYDSGNNVSEDTLQVEPQLPQNLHMPSSYNNDVANINLMEVETRPPPKQHVSHLTTDMFQELEAQLLSNEYIFSNGEADTAKYVVPEMESQLLPNQYMSPITGDDVAKYIFPELESQLLPKQHVSPLIGDHVGKPIISQVRSLVPAQQDELVVCNGLDHNSFATLQSPLYITPGSSYSSTFSNDLDPLLNQNSFSALQSPFHLPPGCLYYGSSSNNSINGLHPNFFSTLQPELSDSSGFSNYSTNGLDHNSFSALQFPIHPLPEFSYSVNGLDHISAGQSPVYTSPGSSYSSWFSNDSNVCTPQFATELEDDLANSHWPAQEDFHKLY